MCNCNKNLLAVQSVSATADNVVLTVSNSTNISSLQTVAFSTNCKTVSDVVTGAPLPVQIIINGTAVSLLNKYSLPILSNRVPRRAIGAYVAEGQATPYVILFTTPCCKCNA